jgi:hypothetical protein
MKYAIIWDVMTRGSYKSHTVSHHRRRNCLYLTYLLFEFRNWERSVGTVMDYGLEQTDSGTNAASF